MIKYILLILMLISMNAYGQNDSIIDLRDHEIYETVLIGNTLWFKGFLRYETKYSYFPKHAKKKEINEGNYYANYELDTICPKGWHVATAKNWEELIDTLMVHRNLSADQISMDTIHGASNNSIIVDIKNLELFSDSLLQLKPLGWVEGKKIANKETLTLWVSNLATKDNKYHLHIGPNKYIKHSHKHNIIDRPKKVRRFAVRCTCEVK